MRQARGATSEGRSEISGGTGTLANRIPQVNKKMSPYTAIREEMSRLLLQPRLLFWCQTSAFHKQLIKS